MKNRLLGLIVCTLCVTSFSQERTSTKKAAATPASQKSGTAYSTVPYDPQVDKLPPNFAGHSVLGIFQKFSPPKPKGEFEKTDEYEARLAGCGNTYR